ncbi:MAG: histidinol dehydrogenase [Flavobacteriales bacterium]|nr:histidinol dehydrogenase [Flavobacteriales bacterium]
MKKIYNPAQEEWSEILKRPTKTVWEIEDLVNNVFEDVQNRGDNALVELTEKFDGVKLDNFYVTPEEIIEALDLVSLELKEAILIAHSNIKKFHTAQKTERLYVTTSEGVQCWSEKRPIQRVGLYVPGGTAPLFSTVLMLAVPAKIAGCKEIVLCTPPDEKGKINPAILFAAHLCGVTKIVKLGGIQAIATMTFGTESMRRVYKIFGPGNQFVTVAKQLATRHGVSIDMPAGPSEVLVVADETANPAFIASDLLSQAEHGGDSQTILVSTYRPLLEQVEKEVEKQLLDLPRKEIAAQAIDNSKLIYVESDEIALALTNEYGPEHFIVCSASENFFVEGIENAGSTFLGNYTPESAGDYVSGTNHTLPTNGFAKSYSGVNLDSFMKSMTFQKISSKGIHNIGKYIEVMAEAEGLHGHKNAVTIRLNSLKNGQ